MEEDIYQHRQGSSSSCKQINHTGSGRMRRIFGWNNWTNFRLVAKSNMIYNRTRLQFRSLISRPSHLCHPLVRQRASAVTESKHGDTEQLSLFKILMENSGTTGLVEMRQSDHGNGLFAIGPVKKDEVR